MYAIRKFSTNMSSEKNKLKKITGSTLLEKN